MNRYIALLRFTEQGARNVKQSTDRARKFNEAAAKAGVSIEGQYWTTGAYDGVLIIRADDAKKALHMLTELAAAGSVRTEKMQAFDDKEFTRITS